MRNPGMAVTGMSEMATAPSPLIRPKFGFFAAILASNGSGRIFPTEVLVKCECAQKSLIFLNA